MSTPKNDKKVEGVALPAQLHVTEAQRSQEKSKQEKHTPDPTDETFAKLIEENSKDANS